MPPRNQQKERKSLLNELPAVRAKAGNGAPVNPRRNSGFSKENKKLFLIFVLGIAIGSFGTFTSMSAKQVIEDSKNLGLTLTKEDFRPVSENKIEKASSVVNKSGLVVSGDSNITIRNQPAGILVKIESVTLPQDGWVVIHETISGHAGNALGARRFDVGVHTGEVELLRSTEQGKLYYAILYNDNGDKEFNLDQDFPILDSSRAPHQSTFVATE